MQTKGVKIPSTLNERWMILWFDGWGVMAFAFCFCIGILINQMGIGALVGAAACTAVQRLNSGKYLGWLAHIAHYYLPPMVIVLKKTIKSYINVTVG